MLCSERLAEEMLVAVIVCEDEPSAPLPAEASDRAPDSAGPTDLVAVGSRSHRAQGPLAVCACR
eukprot:8508622-Pyramimonas_sp.AAC.1